MAPRLKSEFNVSELWRLGDLTRQVQAQTLSFVRQCLPWL